MIERPQNPWKLGLFLTGVAALAVGVLVWFGTRGLALGGGPWGPSRANDIIFLTGWPAMIAAHIAFVLLALGAWRGYRAISAES